MVWYGVVDPRGKLIFFEGGGGCFFQMMSDFFGFFPWVSNHAPSPRPHEPRPLATPRATTPRATSLPLSLVRASSSVLPLAQRKAHPLETIALSPLQPTPTHENAVLFKKVLYLNRTIKCLKSH
jgi:hypothetical protein